MKPSPHHGLAAGWLTLSVALAIPVTTATAAPQTPVTQPPGQNPPAEQDPPTATQERENRVVVTARKWGEESVGDVPRSVTPITAEQIRDAGITSIEQAARYVPGMFVTGFSARRLSFPFIRGVGSGQGDPAVATFVDDVPQLSLSNTNLSLAGIQRIEFLRGPSSSLWGRNTVGGAINMITKRPAWEPGAELSTTFGNYDSQHDNVHATGPIIDDVLAMSFSGSYENREGFTTNAITGNDVDARDSSFGRAQLLWVPNDSGIVRFTLHGEETRDGGFVLSSLSDVPGLPGLKNNPFRIAQDFEGKTERDMVGASLTWQQTGDNIDFTSITSAQSWDIDESADFDFSVIDGVRRFTNEKQDYVYQEFRIESADNATGPKWLAGISGFRSDSTRAATNEFRPGGAGILFPPASVGTDTSSGNFVNEALSVFGQVSMTFGQAWEAGAALRYDYESVDARINRVFDPGGFPVPLASTDQDRSFERLLPRASLSYTFCDYANAYVVAARGFKAGGFNLTSPTGSESFGPETSWTYEVGTKTSWCDDRVTANLALFYIDWDDMQLSQFDPMAGGYVTNAGQSTSQGVEIELAGEVCDQLAVFTTVGIMETEFDSYVDQFGQNVAGNDLPFAPESTLGLGAQWTYEFSEEVRAVARIDYFHTGEFYYDAGNRGAERFELTNFRLGVRGDRWQVDGFIVNAFDEEYVPIGFQANPADPTMFVGSNGAPQIYGASARVIF